MASLYRRSSGTFYASFYHKSRSPRQKRLSLRTDDRDVAERRMERLKEGAFDPWSDQDPAKVWSQTPETDAEELTLSRAFKRFAERKRQQGRKASTIRKYEDVWRLFRRATSARRLANLNPDEVRSFIRDPSIKATTQQARYRHIHAILRFVGHKSVLDGIEKPTVGRSLPKAIREDELRAVCTEAIIDYREKRHKGYCRPREIVWVVPAFWAGYLTGLRGSELGRLKWGHIDIERRRLYIYEQKSGNEDRVPLVSRAADLFQRLYDGEAGDEYALRSPSSPKRERNPTRFREHLGRKFATYRDAAGIRPNLTLHSLRHGFATRLAEAGASAFTIKTACRHADIQTSQIYVHMAQDEVASEMEEAFQQS